MPLLLPRTYRQSRHTSGEASRVPFVSTLQATWSFVVSFWPGEISPDAPDRIAASTPDWPVKRSYESTYSRSLFPTGVVAVRPLLFMNQSSTPVLGSYERIWVPPAVTSSVRPEFFQMYGVDQFVFSSRSARHTWSPV